MFLRAWTRSSEALACVTIGHGRLDIDADVPPAAVLRPATEVSAG
jgi:hypothetical protein